MANDFVTRLTNDATQFNQSFDEATGKVEKFSDSTKKANDEIKGLGSEGVRSTRDLLKEIAKMSGAERSVSNYRRQLSQMSKDIQDLTINYNKLSETEKNSEIGKATLQRINELTTKASEYKDAIQDATAAINAMASDTANWDAAKQGIDTLSSALQGIVSTGVLGAKSTEQLVDVIAKLKAMEAATNAVIKVGNALQKQSALMMGISRVQASALTKAKELEAVATGKATIAQKLFNTVAKANPYVLLASAIITVVGALAAFTLASKKAKEEEEKAQKAHEDYMDSMSDSISKMGDAAYSFDNLAKKYRKCKTEGEKQQFLKDYKSKLDDLGISVNDINGLENVFINKTEDFRKACILRAQAMGLESMQADKYKEMMSELMKVQDLAAGQSGTRVNEGTELFDILKKYDVYGAYNSNSKTGLVERLGKDYFVIGDDVIKDAQDAIRKYYSGVSSTIEKEYESLESQVEALNLGDAFNFDGKGSSGSPTGGSGGKDKPERKADEGTKKKLQEQLSLLQEDLAYMQAGTDEWKNQLAEIERVKAALQDITDQEKAYSNRINNPVQPLDTSGMPKIEGKAEYKASVQIKPVMTPADLKNEYETAAKAAGELSEYVRLGVIDKAKAEQLVANMNETLASHGIKLPVELDIDDDAIEAIREKMESITDAIAAPINAINSVKSAFENLHETMEDPDADGWEKFFAVFQAGESILSAVSTVLAVVNTITGLLTAAKKKSAAASMQEAVAEQAQIGVKGAVAAANVTEAATEGAVASSQAASSVASVPIAGPILAVAAIAAVMAAIIAMISSAKGFATGGIVGGHSYTGDKILARLNSGEMILNSRQQDSLWKDLNENNSKIEPSYSNTINIPDKITMTARGDDLEAVIYNTRKRSSKI